MATIEVERVEAGGLSREVWRFRAEMGYSGPPTLRVVFYGLEERPSSRHKWRSLPAKRYTSSDPRPYNSGIKAQAVPLPVDVAAQAKDLFMHSVTVVGPRVEDLR